MIKTDSHWNLFIANNSPDEESCFKLNQNCSFNSFFGFKIRFFFLSFCFCIIFSSVFKWTLLFLGVLASSALKCWSRSADVVQPCQVCFWLFQTKCSQKWIFGSNEGSEEESTLHNLHFSYTSEEKKAYILNFIMFVCIIYEKGKFILAISIRTSFVCVDENEQCLKEARQRDEYETLRVETAHDLPEFSLH